jgi:recombination protein RecR
MIYPKILEELIEYFKKLPGIGEKSAERLALSIIDSTEEEIKSFSTTMISAKKYLHPCEICGNLTSDAKCSICDNEFRNHEIICVVEDYKSIYAFEKMGKFNGVYHVLNGLISPINGITPYDINIDSLIQRCQTTENIELIIALKPTIEGETTTQYINKLLEKIKIKVSRLSYGLPVGTELDYLDALTLERAFEDRKNIT